MKRWTIFGAVALATCATSGGARAAAATDYQQWVKLMVDTNLDALFKGLRASMEGESRALNQPRNRIDGATNRFYPNPNTILILRPSLGYELHRWATVTIGYAWQPIFYHDTTLTDVSEHRAWEQISGNGDFGAFNLSYRTRFEQRFRDQGGPRQGEGEWAHRYRQQVRVSFTPVANKPWRIIFFDEIFFHLNDTAYPTRSGFDQNRAFLGLGYQSSPELRFELGYLNQYVKRFTDRDQMNHVLMVGAFVKIDTAAKKN